MPIVDVPISPPHHAPVLSVATPTVHSNWNLLSNPLSPTLLDWQSGNPPPGKKEWDGASTSSAAPLPSWRASLSPLRPNGPIVFSAGDTQAKTVMCNTLPKADKKNKKNTAAALATGTTRKLRSQK